MDALTLYRRAIRSGRKEMMSEVAVRLSANESNNSLVDSLVELIARIEMDESADHPTPQEKMKTILKG